MRQLEDKIARLELRSEQLLIRLQQVPRGSPEAAANRMALATMVERLVRLKGERDRMSGEVQSAGGTRHL
jgi:uncharacterized protein involved in exopolysaccharide biosynthesis